MSTIYTIGRIVTLTCLAAHLAHSASLDNYTDVYAREKEKIQKEYTESQAAASVAYGQAIRRIQQKLQKAGDLEGVMAVRAEIERFKTTGTVPAGTGSGTSDTVAKAQSTYRNMIVAAGNKRTVSLFGMTSKYVNALGQLEKSLVKKGNFDEAGKVRDQKEAAGTALAQLQNILPKTEDKPVAKPHPKKPEKTRLAPATAQDTIEAKTIREHAKTYRGKRAPSLSAKRCSLHAAGAASMTREKFSVTLAFQTIDGKRSSN